MSQDKTPNRLRDLREGRGWSQRQLGAEADLTIHTISGLENGQRPSLETALRLAGIFGVAVEELFAPTASTAEVQESPRAEPAEGAAAQDDAESGPTPLTAEPPAAAVSEPRSPGDRTGETASVGNR